jgi:hypothetical protein
VFVSFFASRQPQLEEASNKDTRKQELRKAQNDADADQ